MANAPRRLLEEALTLPKSERLELASQIIARVDGAPDPDWDAAWLEELDARAAAMKSGAAEGDDCATVRVRILARRV